MAIVAPSADDKSNGNALSGTIRLEIDKDSITDKNSFSPSIEVGGIPWGICLRKNVDAWTDHLGCFFHRLDNDLISRSADAKFEIKFVNYEDDSKTIGVEYEKMFDYDVTSWGRRAIVKWDEAIDVEKGFIKDNKFTVQVEFQLSNIQELRICRRVDFTDSTEPSHDIALIVEKEKFFVSKSYLSILSRVFHSMFYGKFVEKDLKEIELKDINPAEFHEMMKVIYPPHKKITDVNFEYLLKLGDRFEIYMVIDNAEKFLIKTVKLTVATKLLFAGRYRLLKLQKHCIDQLTTIKEVTDLKSSEDFKNFSDPIKVVLFDKIIKLSD